MQQIIANIEDYSIQKSQFWESLTEIERAELPDHVQLLQYAHNEIIFTFTDTPQYVYVLLKGNVRLHKDGVSQKQILGILKPYDMVGHRAVIAQEPFMAECTALEECVVMAIEKDFFMHIIDHNISLCKWILLLLSQALANSATQTVNLTQKHIRGRLAESILRLEQQYGLESDGVTISIYLSREDLANMSNMTTANAIRTLSQFAQEGVVGVDGRRIKILNSKELQRIARLG